jgi:hypothetical protein
MLSAGEKPVPQNCRLRGIDTPEPNSHTVIRNRTDDIAVRSESRALMRDLEGYDSINRKRSRNFHETTCKAHIGRSTCDGLARVAFENFGCCGDLRTRRSRFFEIQGNSVPSLTFPHCGISYGRQGSTSCAELSDFIVPVGYCATNICFMNTPAASSKHSNPWTYLSQLYGDL